MSERENTQPKYPTEVRQGIVNAAFEMLGLTHSAARARLDHRASGAAISLWKSGKRTIPQWAAAVLANDMRSQAARLASHAEDLERIATVGRSGNGHASSLSAYRLHRLAQKEKARD